MINMDWLGSSPFDLQKGNAVEKREIEFELLQKLQDLNARIDAAPEENPLANEAKK